MIVPVCELVILQEGKIKQGKVDDGGQCLQALSEPKLLCLRFLSFSSSLNQKNLTWITQASLIPMNTVSFIQLLTTIAKEEQLQFETLLFPELIKINSMSWTFGYIMQVYIFFSELEEVKFIFILEMN